MIQAINPIQTQSRYGRHKLIQDSGLADGRSETSPGSEQIEQAVVKPQMRNSVSGKLIQDSGYAAVATGTVCGITGMKCVKFPHKMKVHKISAYTAAITTFLHWGAVKRWDKKLFG